MARAALTANGVGSSEAGTPLQGAPRDTALHLETRQEAEVLGGSTGARR